MVLDEMDHLTTMQKLALVLALVLFNLLVFWLDLVTGSALSLQPLYVIPVVVAGVLLGNVSLALLCLLSTVLRVEAYRRTAFTGTDFPYLANFATTFVAMLVIGGAVVLARYYRERSRIHQLNSVGRRLGAISRPDNE